MDANDLRDRVEQAILSYINMDVWNRAIETESVELASLHEVLSTWQTMHDPAA